MAKEAEGIADLAFQQAAEYAQQRGLAAAIGARQNVKATPSNGQVCASQHLRVILICPARELM